MAQASSLGFQVEFEKIPICAEMERLKETFGLSDVQLLSMSSTGTILVAVDPEVLGEVEKGLKIHGLEAFSIGAFKEEKRRIIVKDGRKRRFPEKAEDPYERILSGAL